MKFKSEQTAFSTQKKKCIPIWVLDTNALTVSHYNTNADTIEVKTYYSDYVKYHISFSASKYPDRLRKLVNNGSTIEYLDNLELKAGRL